MKRQWIWLLAASGCTPADSPSSPPVDLGSLHDQLLAHKAEPRWALTPDGQAGWFSRSAQVATELLPDRIVAYHPHETEPSWRVELATVAWGRASRLRPVGGGHVWAEGTHFESRRPGLHEWVEATAEHVEHGYTLFRSPEGEGPVTIEIEVTGGVPQALPDGAEVLFGGGSRTLRWEGLLSWDAQGVELPSRVEVRGQRLRVEVDDRGAVWPITVDPTLLVGSINDAPNALADALYGFALDADGDQVVAGAPARNGRARVVNPHGVPAELAAAPSGSNTALGTAVAIDGQWVAVGSPDGEIQIYANDDGEWTLKESLTNTTGILLGSSLAFSEEVLFAGTPSAGAGGVQFYTPYSNSYVDEWIGPYNVTISTAPPGLLTTARLGEAIAASHGWLVAGAPGDNKALVFRQNAVANQAFTETARLAPSSAASFGSAVSVWGDRVAVGAPQANKVFVYENTHIDTAGTADTFTLRTSSLGLEPPFATEGFGTSVAILGDTLAVTDRPADTTLCSPEDNPSACTILYLFEYVSGTTWQLRDLRTLDVGGLYEVPVALTETTVAVGMAEIGQIKGWSRQGEQLEELTWTTTGRDGFGQAVAIDADQLAVGAPLDGLGLIDPGSVSVFARSGSSWSLTDVIYGTYDGEEFGAAVDLAGTYLAIGAPEFSSGTGRGQIYRLPGDEPGNILKVKELAPETGLQKCAAASGDHPKYGKSLDLTTTGLLVGAPYADVSGQADAGVACLYGNTSLGWNFLREVKANVPAAGERMGESVALRGSRSYIGSSKPNGNAGRVEVWDLVQVGTALQHVKDFEGAPNERLGATIAVSANLVALGVPGYNANDGAILLYQMGDVEAYDAIQTIEGPPGNAAQIGKILAMSGARIVSANVNNFPTKSVYVYEPDPQQVIWKSPYSLASGATTNPTSISISDDLIVVGYPDEDDAELFQLTAEGPPQARDNFFTMLEDTTFTSTDSVLANDTDPDGDPISFVGGGTSADGVTLNTSTGKVSYTPPPNAWGNTVTLTYTIEAGGEQDTATAHITVLPAADRPIANPDPPVGREYRVAEDQILSVSAADGVLANDTDADNESLIAILDEDLDGLILNEDGSFTYDPEAEGEVSFTYFAEDTSGLRSLLPATVTIQVVNLPPYVTQVPTFEPIDEDNRLVVDAPGLLSSAIVSDPEGDPIHFTLVQGPAHGSLTTNTTGAFVYTPHPDWPGPTDSFEIQYADDGNHLALGTTTIEIEVNSINDPPIGAPDGPYSVTEDTLLEIDPSDLLQNDRDVENQPLSAEIAQPPAHGTLTQVGLEFIYNPEPDYEGPDTAWYVVSDGDEESEPIPIAIEVQGINDPPRPATLNLGLVEEPETGNVLTGVVDPEGHTFIAVLASSPTYGDVSLSPDGSFTYTPFAGVDDPDEFRFIVQDSEGASSEPTSVTMEVRTDQDPPGGDDDDDDDPYCVEVQWDLAADGDGFGNPGVMAEQCTAPPGFLQPEDRNGDGELDFDCDDALPDVFPGAPEIPGDGRDQDCDQHDNAPRLVGTCSSTGPTSQPLVLLAALALLLSRRGGAR
jgi:hypothetical protein